MFICPKASRRWSVWATATARGIAVEKTHSGERAASGAGTEGVGRELANKRNYLDFFRGLIGGYALWHYSLETDIPESQWIVLSAGGAVVLAGVLIQSVRLGGRVTFFAPIFYLAGLVIAHGNPFVGGFAFLLTCALNPLLSNPGRFLTCFALLLMPFGWFLEGDLLEVLLDAALLLSVPVLSLLAGRPVVIFTKKAELA